MQRFPFEVAALAVEDWPSSSAYLSCSLRASHLNLTFPFSPSPTLHHTHRGSRTTLGHRLRAEGERRGRHRSGAYERSGDCDRRKSTCTSTNKTTSRNTPPPLRPSSAGRWTPTTVVTSCLMSATRTEAHPDPRHRFKRPYRWNAMAASTARQLTQNRRAALKSWRRAAIRISGLSQARLTPHDPFNVVP